MEKHIQIIDKKDYVPSTITMVSYFNTSIDVTTVAKFLPVTYIFKENKKVKLISGTRHSIKYYNNENIIVSVCYKKIRRGMRTGAMNNMISLDIQFNKKNIHVKISETSITNVGTSDINIGEIIFKLIVIHLNTLKTNIEYLKNTPKKKLDLHVKWLFNNCIKEGKLLPLAKIIKLIPSNLDKHIIHIFISYLDDFEEDQYDLYKKKIYELLGFPRVFSNVLKTNKPSIFNSVYHILLSKRNDLRLPLHKLAPYFANLNLNVEFHNWNSEGVIICFPILEHKEGTNSDIKEYKHRFTIHETGSIRQCSPTYIDESYNYYINLVKLIKKFTEKENCLYEKYIKKEL